jgi:deoxyribodipyrimidine photo-lyase
MKKISIHWFRNDLRINDNPSLKFAAENGKVIPIFIHDTVNNAQKEFNIGEASAWWLHYSLDALNKSLDEKVNFFSGDPFKIIKLLIKNYDIESVSWNRCYSPWEIKRDTEIKTYLKESNIKVSTFNSSLLWEPWEVLKDDNSPYKVFSPFYKKGCLKNHPGPRKVVKKIENIVLNDKVVESLDIK